MHGHSTLDPDNPRDPQKLVASSETVADFLGERNPEVAVYLMATYFRADQTYQPNGAWSGEPIDTMARDVRVAYNAAAAIAASS